MADKSSKLLLDTEELTHEFFDHTKLLGIVAPVKDYQFCWNLNKLMGTDLRINPDICIQVKKKKRNYFFAVYEFIEPTGSLSHYIYNNQFDGEYLLPEFRHIDFLWMMKGDGSGNDDLHQKIEIAKSISGVQLVVELTNEKIENKMNLVF
jgi:hypothetical protein